MGAIPGICTQAKLAWLRSMEHDDIWIALYGEKATIDPYTDSYTPAGEIAGQGYEAGGQRLQGIGFGVTGSRAWMDWSVDPRWENATITADSALIYNRSKNDLALCVLKFKEAIVSTNGPWWLELPAPGETAVIRWA